MRSERTSLIGAATLALAAGCAGHKPQTLLPASALAPATTRPTATGPIADTTSATMPTEPTGPVVPASRFVYAANASAGTIEVLGFDRASGSFQKIGTPVSTGGSCPWALAADPSGRFLYCVNRGSNDISCFTIDPESGYLKQVAAGAPRCPAPVDAQPKLVDSKVYTTPFFQVTTLIYDVTTPSVDPATCKPTLTAATGSAPSALAISPDGTRLVVVNRFDASVGSYTIDAKTGMLSPAHLMVFDRKQVPTDVAFDPEGDSFFVCGGPDGFVGRVLMNDAGFMKQDGPVIGVGQSPCGIAVAPDGSRVCVVCHPADTLVILTVDRNRDLHHKAHVKLGADPSAVALDPTGAFAYVTAKNAGTLLTISLDGEKRVTRDESPVSTGAAPTGLALDASGSIVYTANSGEATLSVFPVDPVTHAAGVGTPVRLSEPTAESSAGRGPRAVLALR